MTFYEAANAGARITNSLHLFTYSTGTNSVMGYPYGLEQAFSKFPKHGGFTKSIYEKCLFPKPSLKHPTLGGEIVCLSASPFPDGQKMLVRTVILKNAANSEGYFVGWLPEKEILQLFSAAGVAVPSQTALPTAPLREIMEEHDSLSLKVERYFRDVAGNLGMGRGSWWVVMLICLGGFFLFVLLPSIGVWLWHRSRR